MKTRKPSEAWKQYAIGIVRLYNLDRAGEGKGSDAQAISDSMNEPYLGLSETDKDYASALSEALFYAKDQDKA